MRLARVLPGTAHRCMPARTDAAAPRRAGLRRCIRRSAEWPRAMRGGKRVAPRTPADPGTVRHGTRPMPLLRTIDDLHMASALCVHGLPSQVGNADRSSSSRHPRDPSHRRCGRRIGTARPTRPADRPNVAASGPHARRSTIHLTDCAGTSLRVSMGQTGRSTVAHRPCGARQACTERGWAALATSRNDCLYS